MNSDLEQIIEDRAAEDGSFAIAAAIIHLADKVDALTYQVKCLGTGNAGTEMGALEFLAVKVEEAGRVIADGCNELSLNFPSQHR